MLAVVAMCERVFAYVVVPFAGTLHVSAVDSVLYEHERGEHLDVSGAGLARMRS